MADYNWYTFMQNNSSGGVFTGPAEVIIVEAPNARQANVMANLAGAYFDGYMDCPTCGQRWYETDEYDASDTPNVYGKDPVDFVNEDSWYAKSVLIVDRGGTERLVQKGE